MEVRPFKQVRVEPQVRGAAADPPRDPAAPQFAVVVDERVHGWMIRRCVGPKVGNVGDEPQQFGALLGVE
jgi:hypothetical protein